MHEGGLRGGFGENFEGIDFDYIQNIGCCHFLLLIPFISWSAVWGSIGS